MGDLYISSDVNEVVLEYDGRTGAFLGEFVSAGSGGLSGHRGVTLGPDGALYISSSDNDRVLRYDGRTGRFLNTFVTANSAGLDGPIIGIFVPR